ncbi:PIN domain-containing protein [Luteimonas fraxinea]|uniref:PIN domain-containing protein n=1 Tax=Luteimonas fraxinea TaxID=2901869 RepID=UPI001E3CBE0C|nr:PIN domain-containing protein [Luteimonas fraxinea]UHH10129.1 PIN domain-containing protein [Luteimonas fraxinea]
MPAQTPTPDDIWNKTIAFISIDTNVLFETGFQFTSGALNQLPAQMPDSLHLVFSPVVAEEVKRHRVKSVKKHSDSIAAAIAGIRRAASQDVSSISSALDDLNVVGNAERTFDQELLDYAQRCSGTILTWEDVSVEAVFADYFRQSPPFEDGKKSEFPDAVTLQILHRYAERLGSTGIFVTKDQGCQRFAADSDRIYAVSSLDDLTSLFQATGKSAQDISDAIEAHILHSTSPGYSAVNEAIERHVAHSEWDVLNLTPDLGGRMEAEVVDVRIKRLNLEQYIMLWRDDDADDTWIAEVRAAVQVDVNVSAELYVYDSRDKDETLILRDQKSFPEQIDVAVFVHLTNVSLAKPPSAWNLSFDIASTNYRLSATNFEFDAR